MRISVTRQSRMYRGWEDATTGTGRATSCLQRTSWRQNPFRTFIGTPQIPATLARAIWKTTVRGPVSVPGAGDMACPPPIESAIRAGDVPLRIGTPYDIRCKSGRLLTRLTVSGYDHMSVESDAGAIPVCRKWLRWCISVSESWKGQRDPVKIRCSDWKSRRST